LLLKAFTMQLYNLTMPFQREVESGVKRAVASRGFEASTIGLRARSSRSFRQMRITLLVLKNEEAWYSLRGLQTTRVYWF
jgi:hypothetical protein